MTKTILTSQQKRLSDNLDKAAKEMIEKKFPHEVYASEMLQLAYKMGFIDCLKVQDHPVIANLRNKT